RVTRRRERGGKVAEALANCGRDAREQQRRRHVASDLLVAPHFRPFIAHEEEYAVAPHRASQVAAVLVPSQRRLWQASGVREEAVRIQFLVAEELEQRAVELIGAGLGGQVE